MSPRSNKEKESRNLRKTHNFQKSLPKRKRPMNPKLMESDPSSFGASAKKIKLNNDVLENSSIEYRI